MSATDGQSGLLERHHLNFVEVTERHGKVWRQGPFWFLGNFQPFTLALAFIGPAVGLNGLWTSVAGILGVLCGSMFMAAHAVQGPRFGLPQMIQSRAQFGYRGVVVPVGATTLTFLGFNLVSVVIIKEGLFSLFGWNPTLVALVASAVAVILAIYGHDSIHRVVLVVFWLSVPVWIIVTIGILGGHGGGSGALSGGLNIDGFFAMFAVAASYNITYAPCVSDYTRYLAKDTSSRSLTTAVIAGAAGSPIWLIPLGAWMATRLHVFNALTGMDVAGNNVASRLGTLLVLVAVVTMIVTMAISAYSAMMSVLLLVDSFHALQRGLILRVAAIATLGVAWTILAIVLTNATTVLNDWLLLMLYLLAPWTSVNLTDYYFVRRGAYESTEVVGSSAGRVLWNVRGLSCYLIGLIVEIPFVSIPGVFQSPGAGWLGGVDVSWVIGILVAGACFFLSSRRHSGPKTILTRDVTDGSAREPVLLSDGVGIKNETPC